MIEFYWHIKWVHVAAVILSGSLFFVRGAGVLADMRWPMAGPLRHLTYAVDTTLLIAAFMLAAVLRQYPFVHHWLTAKVLLLVVYIVLGTFALRRGKSKKQKAIFWIAALTVYLFMVSVARLHHPLGALNLLGS
jgi:uncharacterized membrane protein SirB2